MPARPLNFRTPILRRWRVVLCTALVLFFATGCASLPETVSRPVSHALRDTRATALGQVVQALTPAGRDAGGQSGVLALVDGLEAFAARMGLVSAAERSIDIQTYIWSNDNAGNLVFEQMRRAADRGVRVRLLLDDNATGGLDATLALLAGHPGIEVRLFNPFAHRSLRLVDWLSDFDRVNRRMHNKTFVVDNQVAIVGGRNIGDAYFSAGQDLSFEDADLLAVGDAVPHISASFDRFWNSPLAVPATAVLPAATLPDPAGFDAEIQRLRLSPDTAAYREALARSDLVSGLAAGVVPLEWTTVQLMVDEPETVLRAPELTEGHMFPALQAVLGAAQSSLDIVSAYFVPGEAGTAALSALAQRGVRVRVLTNSLAATDVAAAHVGYARHREALLRAGVRLFELKPAYSAAPPRRLPRVSGSQASLHAKTFGMDGRQVFVGSFNFDPRSATLNTEVGLLVLSPAFARQLSTVLDQVAPDFAYEVRLSETGTLQWMAGTEEALTVEPQANALRRLLVRILSRLSIDWML